MMLLDGERLSKRADDKARGAIKFKEVRLLPKLKSLDFGAKLTKLHDNEAVRRDAQRRSFIFRSQRETQAIKDLDKVTGEFEALKTKLGLNVSKSSSSSGSGNSSRSSERGSDSDESFSSNSILSSNDSNLSSSRRS